MAEKALNTLKITGSLLGCLAFIFAAIQLAIIMPERVNAQGATIKILQQRQDADHDLIIRLMGSQDVMNARLTTILQKLDNLERLHMTTKP